MWNKGHLKARKFTNEGNNTADLIATLAGTCLARFYKRKYSFDFWNFQTPYNGWLQSASLMMGFSWAWFLVCPLKWNISAMGRLNGFVAQASRAAILAAAPVALVVAPTASNASAVRKTTHRNHEEKSGKETNRSWIRAFDLKGLPLRQHQLKVSNNINGFYQRLRQM